MIPFPTPVIGLMSGTSADGVDAAVLYTDGRTVVEAGESHFSPYPEALKDEILALMRGQGDAAAVAAQLTDVHIEAARALLHKTQQKPSLIGFHGQTIRHAPAEGITVQIGEPARMAAELGIPVVADFRSNDVRQGGQGAPLVPLYHAALAEALPKPLMVVNIGGVSNVTWVGEARGQRPEVREALASLVAFDSGPGNALMDDWVFTHTGRRCDENGALAARGAVHAGVVEACLDDPFFAQAAPKSLDRLHFAALTHRLMAAETLSIEDGAATLAAITARAIALACEAVPALPRQVLICGGGRKNPFLMAQLAAYVKAPVAAVESVGWDGDMLEAQAFAYLAARSVQGLPLSLPTTTGVREPVSGGTLYSPGEHHHHPDDEDDDCTSPRSCCR